MAEITKTGKCGNCGNKTFSVHEWSGWRGSCEDKELVLYHKDNGIDSIICIGCQTNYTEEDFTNAGFILNFQ